MSVDHSLYLGSYIKLPKCDWEEVSEELEIHIDEFLQVPNYPGVLYSNYTAVNLLSDDGEPQIIEFTATQKAQAQKQFLEEHAESLAKLKKHFKKAIPIKFGCISYLY